MGDFSSLGEGKGETQKSQSLSRSCLMSRQFSLLLRVSQNLHRPHPSGITSFRASSREFGTTSTSPPFQNECKEYPKVTHVSGLGALRLSLSYIAEAQRHSATLSLMYTHLLHKPSTSLVCIITVYSNQHHTVLIIVSFNVST